MKKIVNICDECHNNDIPNIFWRGLTTQFICDICGGYKQGTYHIDWDYVTQKAYNKRKETKEFTIII